MTRFHFHVRDGGRWTLDREGAVCADLAAAAREAAERARAEVRLGLLGELPAIRALERSIIVTDQIGTLVLAAPCYEAAHLRGFEPTNCLRD